MNVLHVIDPAESPAGRAAVHVPGLVAALRGRGIAGAVHSVTSADLASDAQLIHVHGLAALDDPAFAQALLQQSQPIVVSPYGESQPHAWRRTRLWRRLTRRFQPRARILRRAAGVIASTPTERDTLQSAGYRTTLLQPGVAQDDTAVPGADAYGGRRGLLFLGPLHPIEGLVPLLKACEELADEARDWHIVFAGTRPGAWLEMIQAAVERRGLSERVAFLLNPTRAMQRALLRGCEVLVQPSLVAVPPWNALDAWMHGRPALVAGHCGLQGPAAAEWCVTPQRSALHDALRTILARDPAAHTRAGAAGCAWLAEHATWERVADSYKAFYATVTAA